MSTFGNNSCASGDDGRSAPMALSQRACPSTGAFLNGRRASTAGFRTLQVKPCNNNNRHGTKSGGSCAPFRGGAGSPSNTMWPGPRHIFVPSGTSIHPTIWPQYTNVTDRAHNGPIWHTASRFTNKRSPRKLIYPLSTTTKKKKRRFHIHNALSHEGSNPIKLG